MKKRDMVPSLKVYNSLIYVLTHENCFKEALKVLDKVKGMGSQPDATTYNSMIGHLCEPKKLEEARQMLSAMMNDNISPTVETYHAFLPTTDSMQTLEVLDQMEPAKLCPYKNTFLIILERFFIFEQPRKALEIWNAMKNYGVVPESTHYTAMVNGLVDCGWLAKAKELSTKMTSKGFSEDPKLKKLLKKPLEASVKGKPKGRQPKQANRINLKQDRAVR